MSNDPRRLATEEQRERFHLARKRGGMCAACGRSLGPDETVYMEPFKIGPTAGARASMAHGAVGAECAAPEFIRAVEGQEPERCAGCGRGLYYRAPRRGRQQTLCSRNCAYHARVARQRTVAERRA
jgi:hypothetical protein